MRLIGDTRKSKNSPSKPVSRESVESPSIPHVINYSPTLAAAASLPAFGIVMIFLRAREKCKLHSGDDNFHEQTAEHGSQGRTPDAAPGYKLAISVFHTLDLAGGSGPTNAVQSARDRSSITSTGTASKLRACEPRVKTHPSSSRNLRLTSRKRYSPHCAWKPRDNVISMSTI